jgi:putative endonuclease
VQEWLIWPPWKGGIPVTVSWVRIPPSPRNYAKASFRRHSVQNLVTQPKLIRVYNKLNILHSILISIISFSNYKIFMWWYVYILKSEGSGKIYIGSTNNLRRRLTEHNKGLSSSTKPYIPWILESFISIRNEQRARKLEKYFKTGSGMAVLKKKILNS